MKTNLRTIFQSPFSINQWYVLLQDFFKASELKSTPERIESSNTEEGYYLGNIQTSDFYRIGLFHYKITHGSVANKRVGLRNLVKTFINPRWGEFEAALVVFDSGDHWRLSFICDINGEATAAKRYTYVFGSKELLYKTPIDRFIFLKDKGMSFENLKKAFSVEALSDEFFDKYREQYADFIQYITGKRFVKSGSKWEEKTCGIANEKLMQAFGNDEKKIRDYIKKMMGRITFLHFLQRKGWMCGDLNYMQNLFERSAHQDDYLDYVLEPLFFGILNTKPEEREAVFDDYLWDKSLIAEWSDIPYLNGGLFERDENDEPESKFPAELFRRLFNFFSEYNFTIDENDPNDAEVGVDPEMLGKIFENLLEDNKDKGAFYTPKEIVRYMCQESLIAYLDTATSIAAEKIRKFVITPEEGVSDIPENKKGKLLDALKNVKICDPAIGSGAFPMGLLNELLRCREALSATTTFNFPFSTFNSNRSSLKKDIIQNNIYGVDIEKGAVDIARLRFWLSIVVDEETPSPLPNLDYKIMQGNSLIESYRGLDLSKLTYAKKGSGHITQYSIFEDDTKQEQRRVTELLSQYYSCCDHSKKKELRDKISDTIAKQLSVQNFDHDILRELRTLDLAGNDQFFLWHTWFSDVFSREGDKKGFDIVIGNPPYIGEKGHKEIFQPVKADIHLGQYFIGKMDYFYFFFHLAFNMLSSNGIATFITTNYYLTALGARKLRTDIKERMNIRILFNLGELRLFENAPGQHNMISSFSKDKNICKCQIIDVHKKGALNPLMFASIIGKMDKDSIYTEITQENLFDGGENYIRFQNTNENNPLSSILSKIKLNNDILDNICNVNVGLRSGIDRTKKKHQEMFPEIDVNQGVFVVDDSVNLGNADIIKAFYKNSDIQKYYTSNCTDLKVIYSTNETIIEDYPLVHHHLLQYKELINEYRWTEGVKWYALVRPRNIKMFQIEKIVAPQRSRYNTFGYSDSEWFASSDVYYITKPIDGFSLKYILALLNSKLYYIWLYNKGKRKGETLELYQKPLSEIPIKKVSSDVQNSIVKIVDEIITLKKTNPNNDTTSLERQVDTIVYDIYGLTEEEIRIVEGE